MISESSDINEQCTELCHDESKFQEMWEIERTKKNHSPQLVKDKESNSVHQNDKRHPVHCRQGYIYLAVKMTNENFKFQVSFTIYDHLSMIMCNSTLVPDTYSPLLLFFIFCGKLLAKKLYNSISNCKYLNLIFCLIIWMARSLP